MYFINLYYDIYHNEIFCLGIQGTYFQIKESKYVEFLFVFYGD